MNLLSNDVYNFFVNTHEQIKNMLGVSQYYLYSQWRMSCQNQM